MSSFFVLSSVREADADLDVVQAENSQLLEEVGRVRFGARATSSLPAPPKMWIRFVSAVFLGPSGMNTSYIVSQSAAQILVGIALSMGSRCFP